MSHLNIHIWTFQQESVKGLVFELKIILPKEFLLSGLKLHCNTLSGSGVIKNAFKPRLRNRIFYLVLNLYPRYLIVRFLFVWTVSIHELRILQRVLLNFRKSKFVGNSVYAKVLNKVKIYTDVCNRNNLDVIFYFVIVGRCVRSIQCTAWKVFKYGVFSGLYFPAFGLNTERFSVTLRIQSKCGKIRTRKNFVFGHFSPSGGLYTFGKRAPITQVF